MVPNIKEENVKAISRKDVHQIQKKIANEILE